MSYASEGMEIGILSPNDTVLSRFYIPEEALETGEISDEQALHFGKRLFKFYMDDRKALEDFEEKLLKNCTCFWKKQSEEERMINRCHSSECASWEME